MFQHPVVIHKFEISPGKWVFVPDHETKKIGREIKKLVESKWKAPDFYYHLNRGGHVKALKVHKKNTVFCQLDIQNFFGAITKSRVTRHLKSLVNDYGLAREMAYISCVRDPNSKSYRHSIPFGFVQSPILASLCLSKSHFGKKLQQLNGMGYGVSVYVDDITVSHLDEEQLDRAFDELKVAAEKSNFQLHPSKTTSPRESISAFNINLAHGEISITEERIEEFENKIKTTSNQAVVEGIRQYVESVNPNQTDIFK